VKLDNNAVFWAVLDNPVEIGRNKEIKWKSKIENRKSKIKIANCKLQIALHNAESMVNWD
jgi:hypothetical protein